MTTMHEHSSETAMAAPAAGLSGCDENTVLFSLDSQLCGLPVGNVRDILDCFELSHVPLAPREVAGNLNLRGRIVTAIDLRRRLRCDSAGAVELADSGRTRTAIVVEHETTLYALLVDHVSEVLMLPQARRQPKPIGLPPAWARFATCVYEMEAGLVALLDLDPLLALDHATH